VSINLLKRTNPYLGDNFWFSTQTGNAGQTPVRLGFQNKSGKTSAPVIAAGLVRQDSSDYIERTVAGNGCIKRL